MYTKWFGLPEIYKGILIVKLPHKVPDKGYILDAFRNGEKVYGLHT